MKDVESFVAFEWLWRYFNHIDSIMQRCFEEQTLHTLCCLYYCTLSAYLRRKSGIGMGFTVGLRGCLTPNVWTHGKRLAVGDTTPFLTRCPASPVKWSWVAPWYGASVATSILALPPVGNPMLQSQRRLGDKNVQETFKTIEIKVRKFLKCQQSLRRDDVRHVMNSPTPHVVQTPPRAGLNGFI